jgi:hypothetical protein
VFTIGDRGNQDEKSYFKRVLLDDLAVLKHSLDNEAPIGIHTVDSVEIIQAIPFEIKVDAACQAGRVNKSCVEMICNLVRIRRAGLAEALTHIRPPEITTLVYISTSGRVKYFM